MSRSAFLPVVAAVVSGAIVVGCGGPSKSPFTTKPRQEKGMVLLLPGIEGEGPLSYAVRGGLNDAGVKSSLPIYPWGWPIPGVSLLLNQMDFLRARAVAKDVAKYIAKYQDEHPGRPVHIVGHSGGGAIAVFVAEELPDGHKVDGLILLSPSISAGYNLTDALAKTRKGIVNYWSPGDIALLVLGTTLLGNLDGIHGPAAGAMGFTNSKNATAPGGKLYQGKWSQAMSASGHRGGHMDTASSGFVAAWVAPWIKAADWTPPPVSIPGPAEN